MRPTASAQKVDVLLWFAEVEEPVRAHAELRGTRLSLRAPLSLLEIGSQLHYTVIASGDVGLGSRGARRGRGRVLVSRSPCSRSSCSVMRPRSIRWVRQARSERLRHRGWIRGWRWIRTTPQGGARLRAASETRSGRWFGLLCAGALGVAGGAAAMKGLDRLRNAQRRAAARERAARAAAVAAAAPAPAPSSFRVVPDELPAPPPAPPPSLLLHDVLPAMDAIAIANARDGLSKRRPPRHHRPQTESPRPMASACPASPSTTSAPRS